MTKFSIVAFLFTLALVFTGCVRVHHVQVASVSSEAQGFPIEVLIDGIGVDAAKVAKNIETLGKIITGSKKSNNTVSNVIALLQTGPRTGSPIYEKSWGEQLLTQLLNKCPSARLVNVFTQRLATDYGGTGVTREVVLVKATCLE